MIGVTDQSYHNIKDYETVSVIASLDEYHFYVWTTLHVAGRSQCILIYDPVDVEILATYSNGYKDKITLRVALRARVVQK